MSIDSCKSRFYTRFQKIRSDSKRFGKYFNFIFSQFTGGGDDSRSGDSVAAAKVARFDAEHSRAGPGGDPRADPARPVHLEGRAALHGALDTSFKELRAQKSF